MFGRLAASSRSVQTATQADAIDATCGPGAEDAGAGGARDLSRVTTAPSARGAGGGSDARGAGAAGCTRRSPLPLAENLVALLVSGAITGVTATVHTDDEIVFAASRCGACCFAGAALLIRSLWSRILGASGSTITLGAGARPLAQKACKTREVALQIFLTLGTQSREHRVDVAVAGRREGRWRWRRRGRGRGRRRWR